MTVQHTVNLKEQISREVSNPSMFPHSVVQFLAQKNTFLMGNTVKFSEGPNPRVMDIVGHWHRQGITLNHCLQMVKMHILMGENRTVQKTCDSFLISKTPEKKKHA
jgi:hypothetical protein